MSTLANSIKRGLGQAIEFADDKNAAGHRVHIPEQVDVKAIREQLGLTQEAFATRFGFSINTLRHWEQGKRTPESSARAYLMVIRHSPDQVRAALRVA